MKNFFKSGQNRPTNQSAKKISDIQGYVERIDNFQIEGWALSLGNKPIKLSINIGENTHPIKPSWHERSDVANQFGDGYLNCGFRIELADDLAEVFLDACQNEVPITVIADDMPLSSGVDPAELKLLSASLKKLSGQNKGAAAAALGKKTKIPEKLLAELPEEISEGLVAYLSEEIFDGLPKGLFESLFTGQSPSPELDANDNDLLEQFIDNLPEELTVEFPATLDSLPLLRNIIIHKEKTNRIKGFIESIEQIKITGWVRTDFKPINMELAVGEAAYPVDPVWIVRNDVAAQFGDEFLQSGFEFIVPNEVIDDFIDAQAKGEAVEVLVEGIKLAKNPSLLAAKKPKTEKIAEEIEETEPPAFHFKDIFAINAKYGVEISNEDFYKLLTRQTAFPIRISDDDGVNAQYYFELAKKNLIQRREEEGRTYLKFSLLFEKRAEFLEILGNSYLEQGDYETANCHYEAALTHPGRVSKWLFSNLEHCKKRLAEPKQVVKTLLAGIEHIPDIGLFRDRFDGAMQEYWLKQQGELEALAITNNRNGLVAKMIDTSSFIYNSYLRFYGASENPRWVGSCNLERVLIVGDFHIPQCVRYRIDQKVEQLEEAGKEVAKVSWTELANHQNTLAFYGMVIFYRVPAEVQVLKAMAQVNATGKLSIYEIDDLLFNPSYPPPLETYGGYLGLNLYLQLLKGMGSFNAAARYCRFGLASTQPLADELQSLVFGGHCYLHRNGLDSLNSLKPKFKNPDKTTLDIFYGSGTMAHNSDFIDLVLPALVRILEEYPQARLVIIGYLKLPRQFNKQFFNQIKLIPPVKSVRAYWSTLDNADINLAVLHDDLINGCKSELKWFEAACLGIPSVMSSTANYRDVIKAGEDGLLASTADDWYNHIKLLIDKPELRQQMAGAAQKRARDEYSIPVLANNISNVLADAYVAAQPKNVPLRRKLSLVNVFFPPQAIGGATRVVADNFEHLKNEYADQFEISVFTSQVEHKSPYQMDTYRYEGARVYRTSILWRENMDWYAYDEQVGKLFAEYLEAEKPDLIHFHCIQRLSGSMIEAAQKAGIPYLVTVHDAWWISDYQFLVDTKNKVFPEGHPDIYEKRELPNNISLDDSIERVLYLKELLRRADKVLTVSNRFAEIYRKNGILDIAVNKNGISETTPWQPKNTRSKTKVVCGHIGSMVEHKGYFLLKEAVNALQPKNIELLVVDHSHEEGYRHQVLWGTVLVTFIGRVRQDHIVTLYRQIDVLFAPSKWPESYGLVTREAAACGCWVVASNLGGIGEDVIEGQSGFVIEPTAKDLTACLEKIDNEPKRYKGFAEPGPLRSVAEQVKELVDYYHRIGGKIDQLDPRDRLHPKTIHPSSEKKSSPIKNPG